MAAQPSRCGEYAKSMGGEGGDGVERAAGGEEERRRVVARDWSRFGMGPEGLLLRCRAAVVGCLE